MKRLIGWRSVLVLLVIAGFTAWLYNRTHQPPAPPPQGPVGPRPPDYTLSHATVMRYDRQGKLQLKLHAIRIAHEPKSGRSRLKTVRLDYFANPVQHWRVTARRGILSANGRTLDLIGDVHAWQLNQPQPAQVNTSRVTLELKARLLHTRAVVVIHQGFNQLTGKGLLANLDTGKMHLMEDVHGNYRQ